MYGNRLSRRQFLQRFGLGAAGIVGGGVLAACAAPPPQVQVVKETVEVMKEVEVKQTVEVVKEVTKEVIKEVAPKAAEPITLTLWHHWGGTREPLMKDMLGDFMARNAGITVEPTLIPWDRKEETVVTAVAAGQAPDVLMLNASEMPPYAKNNILVALNDMVIGARIGSDEVYESDWKASYYDGKQWGLPQTVGGSAFLLFYSTDAFEKASLDPAKPPTTWAEVQQYTKALLQQEGNDIKRLGTALPADEWSWLNYLAENDALWLSPDGKEVLMDNAGASEALQFIVDVVDSQGGQEKVAAFASAAGDADPFISGRVAMAYSGVWNYYIIQTNAPDLKYLSALAPNSKGTWHDGNYGPHLYTLPTGTKHVYEAWKLLLWLTREEGGCDFLTAQLRPSPWKKCTEESPLAKTASYWPVVLQALGSTRSEPLTPMFNQFASIWNEMIGKATMHQSTAAEAVKWGAEEMAKVNDEYWAKQS